MVGGEQNVMEHIRPLFQLMGKNIQHMGPASSGELVSYGGALLNPFCRSTYKNGLSFRHERAQIQSNNAFPSTIFFLSGESNTHFNDNGKSYRELEERNLLVDTDRWPCFT